MRRSCDYSHRDFYYYLPGLWEAGVREGSLETGCLNASLGVGIDFPVVSGDALALPRFQFSQVRNRPNQACAAVSQEREVRVE